MRNVSGEDIAGFNCLWPFFSQFGLCLNTCVYRPHWLENLTQTSVASLDLPVFKGHHPVQHPAGQCLSSALAVTGTSLGWGKFPPPWLTSISVPSAAAQHLCTAITGVGAPSPCWEGAGSLSHSISRAGKIPSKCFPSQQATLWPVWHRYSVMCQLRLCQMNSRVWSEGCRKICSLSRKTFLMETAR